MGKIKEQTIKGGAFSYIGVLIGAITTGFLSPHILLEDEIGVSKLLFSNALIWSQVASLGFHSVTTRIFSRFRAPENKHHGYFPLGMIVISIGFLLSLIGYFIFLPFLRSYYINAPLFLEYIHYLIPLSFFLLLFNFADTYYTQLYQAVKGVFLKELLSRVLILFSLGIYFYVDLSFSWFIVLFIISHSAPGVILWSSALFRGEVTAKIDTAFLKKPLVKEMVNVSTFGLIIGFSNLAVLQIDSIMLAREIGTWATGVYSIAFFAGTLIVIPSRPLQKIASAFYADAWNNKEFDKIKEIYRKSSMNQFITGALVFLIVWINIDDLFSFLPPSYAQGKYVVFFIGLANWIDTSSGANIVLISTSKHYRVMMLFTLSLLLLVITTNYIFIPIWGIVGASVASMLSALGFNLMRWGFLFWKYKLQPFRWRYLLIIILFSTLSYALMDVRLVDIAFINIILKSTIGLVFFTVPVIGLKLSPDINNMLLKVTQKIFRR